MYSDLILALHANPSHFGPLKQKTHSSASSNPSCGDDLTFELEIDSGTIKNASFYGESCAISRAAASLLAERIIGASTADVAKMNVETMYDLIGSKIHPGRVQCLLLPLEIVQRTIS